MYEELRREMTTIEGNNLELLASLIEKYGYVEDEEIFEAISQNIRCTSF